MSGVSGTISFQGKFSSTYLQDSEINNLLFQKYNHGKGIGQMVLLQKKDRGKKWG